MGFPVVRRRNSAARGTRKRRAGALLLLWAIAGCATPAPPGREARVAEARRALDGDPAVEARVEEVEAAIAREKGEVAIDEVEIRVRNDYKDEHRVGVLARIPVPNPGEVRTRRNLRRAETEVSLARLDETARRRRSELCFSSIKTATHSEQTELYAAYATRQRELLERNEKWRRSGSKSAAVTTRFEITNRIKLARRMPGPAPRIEAAVVELPLVTVPSGRLDGSPALIREAVVGYSPSAAVHAAVSERYRALSERARSQRWPWLDFVDLGYGSVTTGGRSNEFSTRFAVRVPFGARARADIDRYRALGRSEEWQQERLVVEQLSRSGFALEELDYFEANVPLWLELLELAREAETVAEQSLLSNGGELSDVARLFEEAHDARRAVLDERERAGMAGCSLRAMTGIAPADWPRE